MFDPSPIHIILLLVIVLLIFGSKRLPEVGRSLGRGIREFKGSVTGETDHLHHPAEPAPPTQADVAEARQSTPAPTPEIAGADETEREQHRVG